MIQLVDDERLRAQRSAAAVLAQPALLSANLNCKNRQAADRNPRLDAGMAGTHGQNDAKCRSTGGQGSVLGRCSGQACVKGIGLRDEVLWAALPEGAQVGELPAKGWQLIGMRTLQQ